ncbi:MAG: phage major capsid protein [Polaromonas sp.]|nr:phage major capsid protein [Polaromonas sp.]
MNKKMRELLARKAQAVAAMHAMNDAASAAGRDFTDDEVTKFDGLKAQAESTNAAIAREQFLIDADKAAGVIDIGEDGTTTSVDNRAADPKRGFKSFGEFSMAVISAGKGARQGVAPDQRLLIGAAAPSTFGSEAAGADGGWMVPPAYSSDLFRLTLLDNALLPFTANANIDGNSMVFPKTEQTPWGTNGVRAYWQAEAGAGTASKPVIGTQALRLHKLLALVPLTDELMADQSALQSEIPGLLADSIKWKVNEAILFGNGNGQPLGALLSSGPAVIQAKDTGQATGTLSVLNLFGMLSRLPNPASTKAVWLLHPTVIPALATLVLGQIPVFLPGGMANVGSLGQVPIFGTLLGLPIIISHHAAAFSSQADVQLLDLSYYRTITKAEGVATATSLHLYFDADATAMRTTFRVDGSPKIAAAINPAKGSTTLSPFVQLQAR